MAIASLDLLSARLRGHFDRVFEQVSALPSPADSQSNADVACGSDLRAIALLNLGVTEATSPHLGEIRNTAANCGCWHPHAPSRRRRCGPGPR